MPQVTVCIYIKYYRNESLHGHATLLQTTAAGGAWPRTRQRKCRAGMAETALCPSCGGEDPSDLHLFWICCPLVFLLYFVFHFICRFFDFILRFLGLSNHFEQFTIKINEFSAGFGRPSAIRVRSFRIQN